MLARVRSHQRKHMQGFFSGFFQVGKGKKWIFPGGEKRKLAGILPELHTILRVKKLKTLFLSKISGGEKSMSGGELSPPALRKKNPARLKRKTKY